MTVRLWVWFQGMHERMNACKCLSSYNNNKKHYKRTVNSPYDLCTTSQVFWSLCEENRSNLKHHEISFVGMCKHAGLKTEFLKSWHQLFIVEVIIAHMIMRDPKGTSFKMTLNKQTTKWHLCNLVHFGIEFVVSSFVVNTHTLNFSLMYAKIGHFSTFHEVFFLSVR